ncbi:MAG: OmpA family protein [Lysobacteraceae bacterium]
MKKNLLCMAVMAAAFANVAMANDFDDRWYLAGTAGINTQDNARQTASAGEFGVGVGRFFAPEWSLDASLYSTNPNREANQNLNFSQYGVSLDLRRHFRQDGQNWWPYLKAGLGLQRAAEEFNAFPNPNSPGERKDNNLAVDLGGGLQTDLENVSLRMEAGFRWAFDDQSIVAPSANRFRDPYVKAALLIPLGAKAEAAPAPAPAPAPAAPSCETQDDDGDGVNNCVDKCPGSPAGQALGPDGCAVPLTIDLKGVNFDFDKATLRPDAVTILNEAIDILKKYPQLRVEVAGHTDLCGTDGYNQGLSERRAKTVFDYLTGNGVDASRLAGPNGYGESRPLEPTDQAFPACKSEKNRRTELNVQN